MRPRSSDDAIRALNGASNMIDQLLKVPGGMVDLWGRLRAEASTIRAANYDASHGNRVDGDGFNLPDYADPTGDTAADERATQLIDELRDNVSALFAAAERLDRMRHDWLRDRPVKAEMDNLGPGAMWCESCWRDDKHCEPISDRYKKLCRWCGDTKNELGELPHLKLIEARHRGQRITLPMILEYHPNARIAG